MVAGATRLIAGAGGTAPNSGVRFPSELSFTAGTFALGQVLNFGTLVYVANCYGKLRPLHGTVPVGNKSPMPPPPPGLLGENLEVLSRQIQRCRVPNPTVSDHRQMFYMLANVHN